MNGAFVFAEPEGGLEGFEEAGAIALGGFDSVLDDLDLRFEFRDFEFEGVIGALDFAIGEKDAEVALGLEEGEEVFAFGLGRNGDREGDEDRFVGEIF